MKRRSFIKRVLAFCGLGALPVAKAVALPTFEEYIWQGDRCRFCYTDALFASYQPLPGERFVFKIDDQFRVIAIPFGDDETFDVATAVHYRGGIFERVGDSFVWTLKTIGMQQPTPIISDNWDTTAPPVQIHLAEINKRFRELTG